MNDDPPDQSELLLDTHVHTRYSDGTASLEQIVRHCRGRSLGVAVTDHNEIRGAVALCERDTVATIPGIEVGSEEGFDLLVYFSDPARLEEFYIDSVEPYRRSRFMVRSWVRAANCVQAAREMGGYISLAHPFAFGRKSLDYHRRALEMRQEFFPGDHPAVAQSLSNVGGALEDLGQADQSLGFYRQALEMYQKVYPEGHPDVANVLNNLGVVHLALGRPAE